MTERYKGKFRMTEPVRIPIYRTVDGKRKIVGYQESDGDISKNKLKINKKTV